MSSSKDHETDLTKIVISKDDLEDDVPRGLQFSLATLLLVVTLVAVFLAVFALLPGIGIALAVLSLPAFVRTANLIDARRRAGRSTPFYFRAVSFVGSIIVSVFALSVVIIASVGTFCTVCLNTGSNRSGGGEMAILFALLLAAVATVGVVILLVKLIRWRFRRDVKKP